MKKNLLLFSLVAVVVFVMSACTSTGGGSDKKTDKSDKNQVYKIVLSYYASESIPPGQAVLEAIKQAEEKSNGRLKFDAHFSGTYVSKDDTMASLKTGTIDMAPCEASQIASVAVLNQVFNALIQSDLPEDRHKVQEIYVKMVEEIPELQEEMIKNANVMWLYPFVMGGHNLHGNINVSDVGGFKGKKIEAHGLEGQYTNQLGGTAVELDSGDYYNGMKLGTVDAQLTHWAVMNNYQVNEVVKTHTIFGGSDIGSGLTMPAMGYMINKDTWDSLPEDLQKILKESFIAGAEFLINADDKSYQEGIDWAKKAGHKFVYIKGDDRKPWAEKMQPILDKWFKDCEAAGYDGKAVYDKMCAMLAEAAA